MDENNNVDVKKIIIISSILSSPFFISFIGLFISVFLVLGLFSFEASANDGNNDESFVRAPECGFTISKTSFSKQEYKEKVEEFAEKNENFKIFAQNANDIYEYAQSKQINPELVVVRAYVEGHGTTTGDNNYWGIGCTNGSGIDACFDYATFEEGYTDFINLISKYDSLADMMSQYAYIGKFWYNPGSSSLGGCYYANYIYDESNMPSRVKQACASTAPQCSYENTENCTPTTDEDQTAYATWQVEKAMGSARYTIFGLSVDEGPCSYGSGEIQHLSSYNLNAKGLKKLNRALTESEIEELNNYIYSEINKAGYGTGAGVAAAGQSLTYGLETYGYYLGYYWGGDRTSIGVNKKWGTNMGISYTTPKHNPTGPEYGMDCSGFVSWSIRTACNPSFGGPDTSTMVSAKYGPSISISEVKPGDLMLKKGHVRLVVQNNMDGTVIVAEETIGLIFSKQTTESAYEFIDMSSYYEKNCTISQ